MWFIHRSGNRRQQNCVHVDRLAFSKDLWHYFVQHWRPHHPSALPPLTYAACLHSEKIKSTRERGITSRLHALCCVGIHSLGKQCTPTDGSLTFMCLMGFFLHTFCTQRQSWALNQEGQRVERWKEGVSSNRYRRCKLTTYNKTDWHKTFFFLKVSLFFGSRAACYWCFKSTVESRFSCRLTNANDASCPFT